MNEQYPLPDEVRTLLNNISTSHLADPKGQSELETEWINHIGLILNRDKASRQETTAIVLLRQLVDAWPQEFTGEDIVGSDAVEWLMEFIVKVKENLDIQLELVMCELCKSMVPRVTAHMHQNGWIGDECCWDERLRTTE